jgi:hypothetical protein
VIWLIVISFFFAKAFETTGLGERIANVFVAAMGKSSLGLGYGLMVAGGWRGAAWLLLSFGCGGLAGIEGGVKAPHRGMGRALISAAVVVQRREPRAHPSGLAP